MNELFVLTSIFILGIVISSRISGSQSNDHLIAYLPMGIFSSIGFITIIELSFRSSPYGRMLNAGVVIAIAIGILAAYKFRQLIELQFHYLVILISVVMALILVIRNFGFVLLTPDSYAILANASYFRDPIPISFGSMSEVVKRGVTYPVLNGLMDRDNFMVALAPLLSIALIAQVMSALYLFRRYLVSIWAATAVALILLVGFLSMYQVQQNWFYVNTHTLVAGCLTSLAVLGFIWKHKAPTRTELYFASGIGIALSLSRAEGYLLFIVAIVGITSISKLGIKDVFHISILPLIGNVIWYVTLILSFDKGGEALSVLLIDFFLTIAVVTLQVRRLETLRGNFMHLSAFAAGVAILVISAKSPDQFMEGISNCVNNYSRYWGVLLLCMVILTTVAVFNHRSYPLSGYMGMFSLNLFLFSVFAKLSDGGAGNQVMMCRPGWGDSLNRSLMHLMGLMILSSVFILSEKSFKKSPDISILSK